MSQSLGSSIAGSALSPGVTWHGLGAWREWLVLPLCPQAAQVPALL